jgi:hypothetical protein
MKNLFYIFACLLIINNNLNAQVLGGGTNFSNAVIFNNGWLTNCPTGAQTLSNTSTYEPTIALDACAPIPSTACVPTGSTMASDVWFSFYATKSTAKIVVAPTSAFNIVIQAFSGSTCPGLIDIGCANALGNNGTETLDLTGLITNQLYYFRILGIGNNAGTRTGQYTFCGTTDLGSSVTLPVKFLQFSATEINKTAKLSWSTTTANIFNAKFYVEKSYNGNQFFSIGNINTELSNSAIANYTFTDNNIGSNNFYRIKEVDADGKFVYSQIIYLKNSNGDNSKLQVYPNPVKDKINLHFASARNEVGYIKIYNAFGEIIQREKVVIINGENFISLNKSSKLEEGVYTLQLISKDSNLSTRLVCH